MCNSLSKILGLFLAFPLEFYLPTMKVAIFTLVALAVKLGSASAIGNLQVCGFILRNVQDKREIQIQLTRFKIGYE